MCVCVFSRVRLPQRLRVRLSVSASVSVSPRPCAEAMLGRCCVHSVSIANHALGSAGLKNPLCETSLHFIMFGVPSLLEANL